VEKEALAEAEKSTKEALKRAGEEALKRAFWPEGRVKRHKRRGGPC